MSDDITLTGTLLVISPFGVPPFSARGLNQTIEPIAASIKMLRAVNGALVNVAPPQFLLYKSTITGHDQEAPAIDGVWPGARVTVDCIPELAYLTLGGSPQRTVVDGSSRVDGDFTFYRPRLDMMVTAGPTNQTDEWGAVVSWSIDLEEAGGAAP
jgi:hypothetical protein